MQNLFNRYRLDRLAKTRGNLSKLINAGLIGPCRKPHIDQIIVNWHDIPAFQSSWSSNLKNLVMLKELIKDWADEFTFFLSRTAGWIGNDRKIIKDNGRILNET